MGAVRKGCAISPFRFNFANDDILKTDMELGSEGVDLLPAEGLLFWIYVDDIVLFCDDTQALLFLLNQLEITVCRYGM